MRRDFKGAVFVQGAFANQTTANMFYRRGYEIVDTIDLADIVVWTGGQDINPHIYGEKPSGAVGWSERRDADDIAAVEKAGNRFKIGLCRGAQLLNCLPNNGSLWQHVDRHSGMDHSVRDLVTGKAYTVNSLHHQQMRPTDKAEIIAVTNLASIKEGYNKKWHCDNNTPDDDIEALFYPDTKSLCLQWHPEFSRPGEDAHDYLFELLDRYYHAA